MWIGIIVFVAFIALKILLGVLGGDDTTDANNNYEDAQMRVDEEYRKRAAEDYARYARHKAGFVAHGNDIEAARTQAQMDRAMADMIAGSKNSIAKERGKKRPFTPLHLHENKREMVASTQNVFILLNRGSLPPLFRGLNGHIHEAARVSTTVTKEKK